MLLIALGVGCAWLGTVVMGWVGRRSLRLRWLLWLSLAFSVLLAVAAAAAGILLLTQGPPAWADGGRGSGSAAQPEAFGARAVSEHPTAIGIPLCCVGVPTPPLSHILPSLD